MDIQQNVTPKNTPPQVEDFFDDFDFKPLSTGLGFHHENKQQEAVKEASRVVKERSANLKQTQSQKATHPFEQHVLSHQKVEETRDFVQSDLALFYASSKPVEIQIEEPTQSIELAPMAIRLSAFVLDIVIVSALVYFTLGLVSYLTNLDFWNSVMGFDPLALLSVGLVFSSYFLLYFTLLEKFQGKSIGKDVMGIKLDISSNSQMTNVFFRSLITLVGFLSLGLTSYVDLPGVMTRTKVVKR
ncbi:MAG: RDD family protein [Bacteriovoracaceae bacterium]|nr:RDD family protein [Bacteriovoracaceae bacterium]